MTRTCRTIINDINKLVSERQPVSAHQFLEAAQFLAVLMGDEHARLYELEQLYLRKAWEEIEKGKTNAEAEKKAKLSEEYLAYMKQKVFTNQINQFIMIAKKQATLAQSEFYAQS